jgi:methanogenic corrinoid protein MtbC1
LSSLDQFVAALLAVNRVQAAAILQEAATEQGPLPAFEALVPPALEQIGAAWEKGECALAQVYMSGRICEALADALPPAPAQTAGQDGSQPAIAISVLDDYHFLGKQLVRTVLRTAGWTVQDYAQQSVASLVAKVVANRVDILLVSTLMLPSALRVAELMTQLRTAAPGVRVIVGGAPFRFDPLLWQQVGADAMGYNASDAIALVRQMAGERP